jgi:hypothetical protein
MFRKQNEDKSHNLMTGNKGKGKVVPVLELSTTP